MKKLFFIFIVLFFSSNIYAKECVRPIIFPLLSKPLNDKGQEYDNYDWRAPHGLNQAGYESYRIRSSTSKNIVKKSFHVSRDLYTDVYNDNGNYGLLKSKNYVVSVSEGQVLEVEYFYAGTYKVTVSHTTCDGRKFLIRYGEMDPNSIEVKVGDKVKQGQVLGRPGFLSKKDKNNNKIPIDVIADKVVFMLHLEYFKNNQLTKEPLSIAFSNNRYDRREDIADSLEILEEGYKNSFGEVVKK